MDVEPHAVLAPLMTSPEGKLSSSGWAAKTRRVASLVLKVGFSVALLWWVLHTVDAAKLLQISTAIPVGSIVAALALALLQTLLLAWRWHRVVQLLGGALPIGRATSLTFLGLFANQAMPTSIGGDVVRAWGLHRLGTAPGLAINSVLVERLSGLAMLGLLVTVCLPAVWHRLPEGPLVAALLAAGPAAVAGLAFFGVADRLAMTWIPATLRGRLRSMGAAFRSLLMRPIALVEVSALGMAASVTGILAAYALGAGLGIPLGFPEYVSLVGGAVLFSILPISFGGWGVREVAVVILFGEFGIAPEPALALSLFFGFLPLVISLPAVLSWQQLTATDRSLGPPVAGGANADKLARDDNKTTGRARVSR